MLKDQDKRDPAVGPAINGPQRGKREPKLRRAIKPDFANNELRVIKTPGRQRAFHAEQRTRFGSG
jgi:hypothetical protein